ncbi:MAG: transcriptional regulator [Flavobacterium sp.]|nr:MAG: transcriptional regulator [Flavobacterium sp.]
MKNTLKEERLKKQLTQIQLAELVGVSRQTIFSIESNKYVPSVVLSLKLVKVLGRKVEDIFQLESSDYNL